MYQGRVWHRATEKNYSQKILTGNDIKKSDLQEYFSAQWEVGKILEEINWEGESSGQLKDEGIACVDFYHMEIAPQVQPVEVESTFDIPIPLGHLRGKIDLIDDKARIIDHKIMSKSPNENEVHKNIQLGIYSLAYRTLKQKQEKHLELSCLIKTKKSGIKHVTQITERTDDQLLAVRATINNIGEAIQTGIFYPRTDGWHCGPGWCGYWEKCKGGMIK
jgi:hypothetical protein